MTTLKRIHYSPNSPLDILQDSCRMAPVDILGERCGAVKMIRERADLLQGTLDLLILKTLALEPMHGFGISQRIQQLSRDVLRVQQGSLYPALHRLEQRGWINSHWSV